MVTRLLTGRFTIHETEWMHDSRIHLARFMAKCLFALHSTVHNSFHGR
jgi:hypothetical protein